MMDSGLTNLVTAFTHVKETRIEMWGYRFSGEKCCITVIEDGWFAMGLLDISSERGEGGASASLHKKSPFQQECRRDRTYRASENKIQTCRQFLKFCLPVWALSL